MGCKLMEQKLTSDVQTLFWEVVNATHHLLMAYVFDGWMLALQIIGTCHLVEHRCQHHVVCIVNKQTLYRTACILYMS